VVGIITLAYNHMTKYVTAQEMKEIDSYTINECGVPAATLMENAGKAVVDEAIKTAGKGSVSVFCGFGNNGGDGFVVARLLAEKGYKVDLYLIGNPKDLSPESSANYEAVFSANILPIPIITEDDIKNRLDSIEKPALIVDAIFGIGIKGDLNDFYVSLINKINSIGSPVIAVDAPSGMDVDSGEPRPVAIKVAKTVTFGFPKVGFKNKNSKKYTGDVIVADIGLHGEKSKVTRSVIARSERSERRGNLKKRKG